MSDSFVRRRSLIRRAFFIAVAASALAGVGCGVAGKPEETSPPQQQRQQTEETSPPHRPEGARPDGARPVDASPPPRLRGKIAFTSNRGGATDLYMIDLDETGRASSPDVTRLTRSPALTEAFPAWSPRGDMIAFLAKSGPEPARLYLLELGGRKAGPKAISPAGRNAAGANWSPDGRSILYSLEVNGATDVMRYDLATAKTSPLTTSVKPDGGALWSHDGRYVYWSPVRGSGTDVWAMSGDGNTKRMLFGGAGEQGADCVLGKGHLGITLTRGDQWEVGIFSLSSNRIVASTSNSHYDAGIRCSPDGAKVAWTSMKGVRWDILVAEAPKLQVGSGNSTGPKARLHARSLTGTITMADSLQDSAPLENTGPAWSPDSRFIAFESNAVQPAQARGSAAPSLKTAPVGGRHIYVVDTASGRIRQLTAGPEDNRMPAWSK